MPSTDTAAASMDSISDGGGPQRSAPNEVRALSALAFDELRRFPGAIRDMHLGIAERAFRGVGPAATPVKLIHDTLSSRAYGAIGAGASGLGRAVDAAMERRGVGEQRFAVHHPEGQFRPRCAQRSHRGPAGARRQRASPARLSADARGADRSG